MLLLAKIYLVLNLVVFWGYTAAFFVAPASLAARLDIQLGSTSALADFRAMYGGMCLGVGVIFLLGLLKDGWRAPAVLLAVTTAAGLLTGRLWTWAADGAPSALIFSFMGNEVAAVALGVFLLRRLPRQAH